MTFITKNKDQILDIIQISLFFLLGFKFLNLDMHISILLFAFIVFRLLLQNNLSDLKQITKKEVWDILIVVVFAVSTVLFKSIFDGASMLFKNTFHFFFLVVMFWLSSRTFSSKIGFNGLTYLISYYLGVFLYISLSAGATFAQFGLKSDVRLFMDVWTKEYITCTIASIYLIPVFMLSISAMAYLIRKKHFVLSVALLIPIFIAGYISFRLQNRGFFVAVAIALFFFCYVVFFQFNSLKASDKDTRFFFLAYIPLALSLIALVFTVFTRFNVFGLADIMKDIPFLNRIISGGTDKARSDIYNHFFQNCWRYPFGGLKQNNLLGEGHYVHNAFLDLYAVAGIVPFICFIYFFVRFIIVVIFKKKYHTNSVFFMGIISIFLALFAISFFEPIFDANAYYFASFFGMFSIVTRDYPLSFKKKIVEENTENKELEMKEETNENASAN